MERVCTAPTTRLPHLLLNVEHESRLFAPKRLTLTLTLRVFCNEQQERRDRN